MAITTAHTITPRGAQLADALCITCSGGVGGVLTAFASGTLYGNQPRLFRYKRAWVHTHLRVDPVLRLVFHRHDLARSPPLTRLRRHAAHGVQPVDLLDGTTRALRLGLETQPLDVLCGLGRVAVLCFLGLRVAEADDVKVRRRAVDEEVRANRFCRLFDCAESARRGAGIVGQVAGCVKELGDGADGCGGRRRIRTACVVLRAFAQRDEDECQVRAGRRERAWGLCEAREVTC
jgi:hypothetical protein